MWRSALALGAMLVATGAAAQSHAPPSDGLRNAAFSSPAAADRADPQLEQRLSKSGKVYLFAGAKAAQTFPRGDPRWSPQHDANAGHSLVDTKLGVGWRKGGVETSLGYMKRQVTDAPMLFGDKPRKDSMVGLSIKLRPGF